MKKILIVIAVALLISGCAGKNQSLPEQALDIILNPAVWLPSEM